MSGKFEEIVKRIKQATTARTQIDLAVVLGIRQSSISDAKRRGAVPSSWLITLFDKYQLNPNWVSKGVGPVYLRNAQICDYDGPGESTAMMSAESQGTYDCLAANSTAGVEAAFYSTNVRGGAQWTPVQDGMIAIPKKFHRPGLMVVSQGSSSMEPVIHKDAYIGIDSGQKNIVSGELYALSLPFEGLTVKRVFFNLDKMSLELRDEVKDYPEIIMPMSEMENKVIGRVIWVMQNL